MEQMLNISLQASKCTNTINCQPNFGG